MKKAIKYVYVAAPYISNPIHNTHQALEYGNQLIEAGFTPIIPHVHLIWNIHTPRPENFWLKFTLDLMLLCDAVIRFPGESRGADEECRVAKEIGIPVFKSIWELRFKYYTIEESGEIDIDHWVTLVKEGKVRGLKPPEFGAWVGDAVITELNTQPGGITKVEGVTFNKFQQRIVKEEEEDL